MLHAEAASVLDVHEVPELYVTASPVFTAMTIGLDKPKIVVNSALVDLLDDDELRFVLGHELGHALSGHALYRTLLQYILTFGLTLSAVPFGGDGDTPMAAGFAGLEGTGFALTNTAVARYCFDLSDWENCGWVVPLGASGHPGSPHYADQVESWRTAQLLPMRYDWGRITREAATVQGLTHLIARVLMAMEPLPTRMTTASFDRLMQAVDMVRHDSPAVFRAIERDNPFAAEVRERFFDLADQARGTPREG